MENALNKNLTCPSCGHDNFNPEQECLCGYQADESFIVDSFLMESEERDRIMHKDSPENNSIDAKNNSDDHDAVIKEIDSWVFRYSQDDNCIRLGTPALQNFSLTLTVSDLEELLEILYRGSGHERTTRKLNLSTEEVHEILANIHGMIKKKQSQIALAFSSTEMDEVASLINLKLKT